MNQTALVTTCPDDVTYEMDGDMACPPKWNETVDEMMNPACEVEYGTDYNGPCELISSFPNPPYGDASVKVTWGTGCGAPFCKSRPIRLAIYEGLTGCQNISANITIQSRTCFLASPVCIKRDSGGGGVWVYVDIEIDEETSQVWFKPTFYSDDICTAVIESVDCMHSPAKDGYILDVCEIPGAGGGVPHTWSWGE